MVIYKRVTSPVYTQLVGCILCTLWKGLGAVAGDGNFGFVAMADAMHNRTVYTRTSKPSQPWTHQRQPLMSEYVSAGYPYYALIVQLLARYHNLRMSIRTFKKRLRAFGIQRRLNPATPDTVRDCITQQLQTSAANVGYRQMHRILPYQYGLHVSRNTAMKLLSKLDPVTSASRRRRAFTRRVYYWNGSNQATIWDHLKYFEVMCYTFEIFRGGVGHTCPNG